MGGEEGPAGGRGGVCWADTRDQSAGCHNQERVSQNEVHILTSADCQLRFLTHYILFTYFSKLLKLKFLTQYILLT